MNKDEKILNKMLMLTEKQKHNLKAENFVLLSGQTEDVSPGGSLSDTPEGLFQRSKEGTWIYSFCNKKQVVRTSKDDC